MAILSMSESDHPGYSSYLICGCEMEVTAAEVSPFSSKFAFRSKCWTAALALLLTMFSFDSLTSTLLPSLSAPEFCLPVCSGELSGSSSHFSLRVISLSTARRGRPRPLPRPFPRPLPPPPWPASCCHVVQKINNDQNNGFKGLRY